MGIRVWVWGILVFSAILYHCFVLFLIDSNFSIVELDASSYKCFDYLLISGVYKVLYNLIFFLSHPKFFNLDIFSSSKFPFLPYFPTLYSQSQYYRKMILRTFSLFSTLYSSPQTWYPLILQPPGGGGGVKALYIPAQLINGKLDTKLSAENLILFTQQLP